MNKAKNSMKRILSLALALSLSLCMAVGASAANIETSGGSGTTPVNLSSTSGGDIGGDPSATALSVTVPTALPMAMAENGDVTTASNCQIVNNSYGAVRVKSVTITAGEGWHLTAFGDKSTLASEKVDSNKLGFALKLGNGTQNGTTSGDASTQALISAPSDGCYMSGVGNTSLNKTDIKYNAIVTPLSSAVTDATVANVDFIVEWDAVS